MRNEPNCKQDIKTRKGRLLSKTLRQPPPNQGKKNGTQAMIISVHAIWQQKRSKSFHMVPTTRRAQCVDKHAPHVPANTNSWAPCFSQGHLIIPQLYFIVLPTVTFHLAYLLFGESAFGPRIRFRASNPVSELHSQGNLIIPQVYSIVVPSLNFLTF